MAIEWQLLSTSSNLKVYLNFYLKDVLSQVTNATVLENDSSNGNGASCIADR